MSLNVETKKKSISASSETNNEPMLLTRTTVLQTENNEYAKSNNHVNFGSKTSEELESFANCSVCLSKYNDNTRVPRVLHCGHTFCNSCIKNVIEYGDSMYVECPSCRTETKKRINEIPKNFVQLDLLTKLNLLDKSENETDETTSAEKSSTEQLEEQSERNQQFRIERDFDVAYKQLIGHIKTAVMTKLDNHKASDSEMTSDQITQAIEYLRNEIEDTIDGLDLHDISWVNCSDEENTDDEANSSALSVIEEARDENEEDTSIAYLSSDTRATDFSTSISSSSFDSESSSFISASND